MHYLTLTKNSGAFTTYVGHQIENNTKCVTIFIANKYKNMDQVTISFKGNPELFYREVK